jgi:hypothetical protein
MEQNKKECKQCKKGLNNSQISMLVLGFYILGSSVYGTIQLIKLIKGLF